MTQEMLDASYKPKVVVRLLGRGLISVNVEPTGTEDRLAIILSVKNAGPGVAHKIKFEGDLSFSPNGDNHFLRDVYFLENGIDSLVPGEARESDKIFISNPSGVQTTIRGTWEDAKGNKHCGDFPLNFTDPDLPYE